MICGSLTRTETLQLPSKQSVAGLPMQFEDYVVAELSKINTNSQVKGTLVVPRTANLRDGESKRRLLDGQATGICFLKAGRSLGVNSESLVSEFASSGQSLTAEFRHFER